jgi:hypothetical protein
MALLLKIYGYYYTTEGKNLFLGGGRENPHPPQKFLIKDIAL